MNQGNDYKYKFERMRGNNPAQGEVHDNMEEHYPAGSHARNLLFILPNGNEQFLNYSYMVSAEFLKDQDCIKLEFTTHIVEIKGAKLLALFRDLFEQVPKVISCTDERYNALEENTPVINDVTIKENRNQF